MSHGQVMQQSVDEWQLPGEYLHRLMDELRARGPLVPVRFMGGPAWLLTRHGALEQAFKDTQNMPPHLSYQAGIEPLIGETFQTMTGERHRFYRKLATPMFRPRVVDEMDASLLVDVADELLHTFLADGSADLVAQFSERYPFIVIARLLGIPRDAEQQFAGWVGDILKFNWAPQEALRSRDELWAYLDPVIEQRRHEPADDIISHLIHDELDGVRMSPAQIKAHLGLMFTAGSSTTHDSLGNLVYALLANDDCWQQVRESPALRDAAVEEALRWEPAVSVLPRMSRADGSADIAGQTVPPGSIVLMGICAANHDPAAFDEPHRYNLHRDSSEKLTFGHGPRTCPGMHLARKELRVTLDILLQRLPELELVDEPGARPVGTIFRHPRALHCTF